MSFLASCAVLLAVHGAAPQSCPQDVKFAPYSSIEAYDEAMYERWKESAAQSDPRLYLAYYGAKRGLSDNEVALLDNVMACESRYCTDKQNAVSSAAGCFQIVRGTWNAYSDYSWVDRYDNVKNIETAINLYQQSGIHHWQQCL